MADVKISALPAGTAAGADVVSGVQSATTKKFNVKDVAATLMDGTTEVVAQTSIPASPASGNGKIYFRNIGGKVLPEWRITSGEVDAFQPALFGDNITLWVPGTGTTAAISFGVSWTIAATQAHPALASTNFLTQMKQATYTTTATSGNAAGIRSASTICWRSNAAGQGGFFFFARFGFVTTQAAMQFWVGLSGVTGLLAGDPSAQNDTVCVGKDTGDTNIQIITRSGAANNKTNTGTAPAANDVYDVFFYCPPNGSNITARLVNVATGTVLVDNTALSTNLPTNTVFLTAHAEVRAMTAAAVAIALNKIYIATDS